jgi:hypothetical protein
MKRIITLVGLAFVLLPLYAQNGEALNAVKTVPQKNVKTTSEWEEIFPDNFGSTVAANQPPPSPWTVDRTPGSSGNNGAWLIQTTSPPTGATRFARINATTPRNAWMFRPIPQQLEKNKTYRISFHVLMPGVPTGEGQLTVKIGQDATRVAMASGKTLVEYTTTVFSSWARDTIEFTVPEDGTYFIGFHAGDSPDPDEQGMISVGNISLEVQKEEIFVPTYGISLSQTGTYAFPDAIIGQSFNPLSVVITNTGNMPTGRLRVDLSGEGSSNFMMAAGASGGTFGEGALGLGPVSSQINIVDENGTFTFRVRPNPLQVAGSHTATIAVSSYNNENPEIVSQSFTITYSVGKASGYTVPKPTLAEAEYNWIRINPITTTGQMIPQSVEYAINTANNVDATSLTWQASTTFTGLEQLTDYYVYARSVENSNYYQGAINVSEAMKTLAVPFYEIELSEDDEFIFADAIYNYGEQTPFEVTITNRSNRATGNLTVALSGSNAFNFTLSGTSVTSIAIGGAANFTVAPNTGLNVGTYTAMVSVGNANIYPQETFDIEFTVTQAAGANVNQPTLANKTHNSIIVNAVQSPPNMQTVEYAQSTVNNANASTLTWQTSTTFSGLIPETTYYVYARSAQNMNYFAGTPSVSVGIETDVQDFRITLDKTGMNDFPDAIFGYPTQNPITITITNSGNSPTGVLNIALSGANEDDFTLSGTSTTNIFVGNTENFSVTPKIDLDAGTYTATVTVSGNYDISESFDVSFTVNQAPGETVLAPTSAVVTYNSIQINPVMPPSNGQLVEYAIALANNTDAADLTWQDLITFNDRSAATNYYVYARATENTNYLAGPAVVSAAIITADAPNHSIALSETTLYTFVGASYNYSALNPLTVTITNVGNQATGNLNVALSGANPTSFTVTPQTVPSIATSGTGSFTIVPNTGLAVGTYTATVSVGNANITPAETFTVSFTVTQAQGITVDKPTVLSKTHNSITVNPITTLNGQPVEYAIGLTNNLTKSSLTWQIGTEFLTLASNTVYYVYARSVGNANFSTGTPVVSDEIRTNDVPTYGIVLSQTGTHAFGPDGYGYPEHVAHNVTITNTGNQPTGALTIALSGANQGSFTLSKPSVTDIVASGTDEFTVRPNIGLAIGTYTATVTVDGANVTSQSFDVSFTVVQGAGAIVEKATFANSNYTSITINAVPQPSNGQSVQYAINMANNADISTLNWQSGLTFTGLNPGLTYYVYARSVGNANFLDGTPSVSDAMLTRSTSNIILDGEKEIVLTAYPNPVFDGRLFLEIPENLEADMIYIYNHTGKLLYSRAVNRPTTELNISHLPNGTLFVRIGSSTVKIIKQ